MLFKSGFQVTKFVIIFQFSFAKHVCLIPKLLNYYFEFVTAKTDPNQIFMQ